MFKVWHKYGVMLETARSIETKLKGGNFSIGCKVSIRRSKKLKKNLFQEIIKRTYAITKLIKSECNWDFITFSKAKKYFLDDWFSWLLTNWQNLHLTSTYDTVISV